MLFILTGSLGVLLKFSDFLAVFQPWLVTSVSAGGSGDHLLGGMGGGAWEHQRDPGQRASAASLLFPASSHALLWHLALQEILSACWAFDLQERPSFPLLMDMLEKLPKLNRRLSHPGHFWKSAE